MLKGMIFIDHMNFDIALQSYYKTLGRSTAKLDYNKLFEKITKLVDNVDFVKASIFVPKPEPFLMADTRLNNYYTWVSGLGNAPFTDVIEGRYCARPVNSSVPMNIANKSTYYKVEKGTDINLAVDAINKAFHNSYDIAYVVSADTDYIKVYDVLKSYGKLVVVVVVEGQSAYRIKPHVDAVFTLDDTFFSTCLRTSALTVPTASGHTVPSMVAAPTTSTTAVASTAPAPATSTTTVASTAPAPTTSTTTVASTAPAPAPATSTTTVANTAPSSASSTATTDASAIACTPAPAGTD